MAVGKIKKYAFFRLIFRRKYIPLLRRSLLLIQYLLFHSYNGFDFWYNGIIDLIFPGVGGLGGTVKLKFIWRSKGGPPTYKYRLDF